ncbi:FRG domain-containing protein [Sphingomonas sp. 22R3R2A-7]|uniref:FRG domain-containing protein n=1 Tax=Sphingomonas sp. 22R3R2A-7 TaxID=3050230 RepID=UPI002FDF2B8C
MAEPYFRSLPLFPAYAIGDVAIDGLVPACRVESWEAFIVAMRSPEHNLAKGEMVYRGQAGHDWHLSSTLARLFDGGSVPQEHQDNLLAQFRLAMRGRGLDCSKLEDEELWAFGQHHGLRTPLIDWTKSPYVALFFAFDEPDVAGQDNPSRAVFCLNMAAIRADESLSTIIFEPTHHENARLVNQAGLFTITPSGRENLVSAILNELAENEVINPDDPMDVARYISKIHVPNENRVECLNTLRKMNIHHANLFPDPGGASKYSNDWLSRLIAEERRDAAAAAAAQKAELEKRVDPAAVAAEDGENPELISKILRQTLGNNADFPDDLLANWSGKIESLYSRNAEIDWPKRPASQLRLKLDFRRFFLSNGLDKEMAEICARRMIGFFIAKWRVAHKEMNGS